MVVEHKIKDSLVYVPLECSAEELSTTNEWNRESHVENIFVEHGDQIIFSPHQAIRNIMGVHSLLVLSAHEALRTVFSFHSSRMRIGISQSHQATDDILPCSGLDVAFRYVKQIMVKVVEMK